MDQGGEAIAGREGIVAAIGIDDQVLGGSDVQAEGGGTDAVEPDPGAVGGGRECFGAIAAVDLDGVVPGTPSLRSLPSPGFQIIRSSPDWPKTWSSPEPPISVSLPSPPNSRSCAALAQEGVVARLAKEHVVAAAAGEGVVAGAAEEVRLGQGTVALVKGDGVIAGKAEHLDQTRVGDGGCPAPDLHGAAVDQDRAGSVAADDDRIIVGIAEDGQQPGGGRKDAEIDGRMRSSSNSKHGEAGCTITPRRTPAAPAIPDQTIELTLQHAVSPRR